VALSIELAEKVEALYRKHLAREFGNQTVFDAITVEPTTNYVGEEVPQVTIVYEGAEHTIDPRRPPEC
jgi:hypothetical protein